MNFNPSNYKEADKKLKIIRGKDVKSTCIQLDDFLKTHPMIADIKMGSDTMYFVFYWEV